MKKLMTSSTFFFFFPSSQVSDKHSDFPAKSSLISYSAPLTY